MRPLTTALDEQYGGGLIASYNWNGRIQQVGVSGEPPPGI